MTTEPNTITFHNSNADWVMRITADRRIEVNEDVEVTEAAQKVLDAMQYLLKAQRPWVEPTESEWFKCWLDLDAADETEAEFDFADFLIIAQVVTAKLKEKNGA